MSGWKYRMHHQKLAGWSLGGEVGGGKGAGWLSYRVIAHLGRHYFHAMLTYDYPRGAGN